MTRAIRALIPLAAALAVSAAVAGEPRYEPFTCIDADGNVSYQDDPCAKPKPKKAPASPPAAPAPPPQPKAAKADKPRPTIPPPAPPSKLRAAKPPRAIINATLFSADPQWGSPEKTLRTFLGAVRQGDRTLARECLTEDALAHLGTRMETFSVDGYTGFVLEGEVGPFWSIRALRSNTRPKWIFFERFNDGTWKISSI